MKKEMGTIDSLWHWNPDFLVESGNSESLVIRNDITGALVALSRAEYDLLQAYGVNNDYKFMQEALNGYELDEDVFHSVIRNAQQLDILIPATIGTTDKKRRQSTLKMKLVYIANRLVSLLQLFTRRPLRAECSGNLRFFKLCSIDLEGGLLHRMATSRHFQQIVPAAYLLSLACLITVLAFHAGSLQFAGFAMNHINVWALFITMLAAICLCLFWHESGHYIVYKRYGGCSDRMGMGTLFGFFPVFYTQIDQIHLWTDRRQRILLTAAGMLADVLSMLALTVLLSVWHRVCFFNLLIDCMFFYYVMQMITNLNMFIPGTDGYYLFEELTGRERLYGRAFETARSCWREIFRGHWPKISLKQWLQIIYFILCCICITCYWAFAVVWITFPLWAGNLF